VTEGKRRVSKKKRMKGKKEYRSPARPNDNGGKKTKRNASQASWSGNLRSRI